MEPLEEAFHYLWNETNNLSGKKFSGKVIISIDRDYNPYIEIPMHIVSMKSKKPFSLLHKFWGYGLDEVLHENRKLEHRMTPKLWKSVSMAWTRSVNTCKKKLGVGCVENARINEIPK